VKAFLVDRYGGPDVVRAGEMPDPEVQDHDVLVEIHAAGVNQLDTKIRAGEFKRILPYRLPVVLGNDLAGVVVRVGSKAQRFQPGDEVYARPDKDRIGTFAERISVHEDDLALKPRSLTMEEAASVPLVALTAWQALVERANLRKGQRVLIQAGSGGVGDHRDSAGEASRCDRCHDHEQGKCGVGEVPGCRHRYRLQARRLRNGRT
jgi:NADPH:quinone reductase-like Zn-dependent oxidoreductase